MGKKKQKSPFFSYFIGRFFLVFMRNSGIVFVFQYLVSSGLWLHLIEGSGQGQIRGQIRSPLNLRVRLAINLIDLSSRSRSVDHGMKERKMIRIQAETSAESDVNLRSSVMINKRSYVYSLL